MKLSFKILLLVLMPSIVLAQLDDISSTNNGSMTLGNGTSTLYQFAGDQRGTDGTNQSQGGFGLLSGSNQISPIIWMYGYDDRNAFQVIKKGYNSTVQNGSVLFHISANGKSGVGTANPKSKLHIYKGNSGGNPHGYSGLTFEDNDHGMISILTPNNKYAYFGFSDSNDDYVGGMQYDHANDKMIFRVNNHGSDMTIDNNGNVGIGTTTPTAKLQVAGNGIRASNFSVSSIADLTNNSPWYGLGRGNFTSLSSDNLKSSVQVAGYYGLLLKTAYGSVGIHQNGNVGIGTTTPDSKLSVNGNIHAKEVKVDLVGWPDYVFKNDYELPTLEEVEQYIKEKGHLINIPSAKEVEEDGIQLGKMNKLLLEKIEELTLYTLQQQKELQEQKALNSLLLKRLDKIEKQIDKLNDQE